MSQAEDPRDVEIKELRTRLQGALADIVVLENRNARAHEMHVKLDLALQEKTNRVRVLEGEKAAFRNWTLGKDQ